MKEYLKKYLDELQISYTLQQLEQFETYHILLAQWNEKMNLTAIREPQEVALKHFADCLYGMKYIPQGARLIDVGSGAGFPGVPLKIMRPDIEVLLLDSLNKRIVFLQELIQRLGLSEISAVHGRAEESAKGKWREKFDIATARAVANLSVLSEYCLPYVKIGGCFLAYKGSSGFEELAAAESAIQLLGAEVEEKCEYILPDSDIHHTLAVLRKTKNTPLKYPRNAGQISKKPLT